MAVIRAAEQLGAAVEVALTWISNFTLNVRRRTGIPVAGEVISTRDRVAEQPLSAFILYAREGQVRIVLLITDGLLCPVALIFAAALRADDLTRLCITDLITAAAWTTGFVMPGPIQTGEGAACTPPDPTALTQLPEAPLLQLHQLGRDTVSTGSDDTLKRADNTVAAAALP